MAMELWRVDDVMTKDVVSVREETPYREVVDLLLRHRISALPVLTRFGLVVGVVSEADLAHKVEAAGERARPLARHGRARRAKAAGQTAAELMTAPAVTAEGSMSIATAARKMREEGVKRLPVVDEWEKLVGIVTRTDLLRVPTAPGPSALTREAGMPKAGGDDDQAG